MTFWPLTNSDLPTNQTFHQFHDLYTELDLHRIMSGFHGAFATGVASQQGTLTLPDTWFRPPFWDLLMLQLLRPNSSNLPCLYSTFHLEYPLVLSRFYLALGKHLTVIPDIIFLKEILIYYSYLNDFTIIRRLRGISCIRCNSVRLNELFEGRRVESLVLTKMLCLLEWPCIAWSRIKGMSLDKRILSACDMCPQEYLLSSE